MVCPVSDNFKSEGAGLKGNRERKEVPKLESVAQGGFLQDGSVRVPPLLPLAVDNRRMLHPFPRNKIVKVSAGRAAG